MARALGRGFTLVELSISLVVFAGLMVLLLQSLIGVTGFVAQEEALGDVEVSGRSAVNRVTNEMANSAWFFSYLPSIHQYDSNAAPLYPAITLDSGTAGAADEKDALEYIKIRTSSTIAASPDQERYDFLQSSTSAAPAVVTLDQYNAATSFTACATPFLILNPNYPQAPSPADIYVTHVWEYWLGSATTQKTFDENLDATKVRHYRLSVANIDASTGTGQLVRSYYNANGSLPTSASWIQLQPPLLDNVKSLVITNHYTAGSSLNENQFRFSVVVVKPEPGRATTTVIRTFTFTCAMRSITR